MILSNLHNLFLLFGCCVSAAQMSYAKINLTPQTPQAPLMLPEHESVVKTKVELAGS